MVLNGTILIFFLPLFLFLYMIPITWGYMYGVRLERQPLNSKDQTGRKMYSLIRRFSGDLQRIYLKRNGKLIPLSTIPLLQYFNLIKNLPYRRDTAPVEVVARPAILMRGLFSGLDCKKKSLLIGSWLRVNGKRAIKNYGGFRLVSVSTRPDKKIHHVFPQVKIGGRWLNLDATYSDYKPFQKKLVTKAEILKP